MDLLSGTGVATALRNVKWSKALPYAGSTIAVRLVIPKNKTPPRLQLLGKHNHAIEKKM